MVYIAGVQSIERAREIERERGRKTLTTWVALSKRWSAKVGRGKEMGER